MKWFYWYSIFCAIAYFCSFYFISALSCGDLSTPNTVYTMDGDLSAIGTCFNITVDNITLDGNGWWMDFNTGGFDNTNGISVTGNLSNITIKNMAMGDNGGGVSSDNSGIYIENSLSNSIIEGNDISTYGVGNVYGSNAITVLGVSTSNLFFNNILDSSNSDGIYINSSINSKIYLNDITAGQSAVMINDSFSDILERNSFSALYFFEDDFFIREFSLDNVTFIDQIVEDYFLANSKDALNYVNSINFINSSIGKITLFQVYSTGNDLIGNLISSVVQMTSSTVFVDSNTKPTLNVSANITLYNLQTDFLVPVILKDGSLCPSSICTNYTSLNAGNVSFGVSQWSNYSIEENVTFNETDISKCGNLNHANFTYHLIKNISNSGTCIYITANNVTLKGEGYSITSNNAIDITNFGYNTVENITLITTNNGIVLDTSSNNTFFDINIIASGYGINLGSSLFTLGSNSNNISNNYIFASNRGINLYSSDKFNLISDNIINSTNGIYLNGPDLFGTGFNGYLQQNSLIRNNITASNYGIYLFYSYLNDILHNKIVASVNGVYLQRVSDENSITNNTIQISGIGHGIFIDLSKKNKIVNNILNISYPGGSSIFLGSSAAGKSAILLSTTANENNISYNEVNTENIGIEIRSPISNIIMDNRVNSSFSTSYIYDGSLVGYTNTFGSSNLAEGKPLNYTYNAQNIVFSGLDYTVYGEVLFVNGNNITIQNSNFTDDSLNLYLIINSKFVGNNMNTSKGYGFLIEDSSFNLFANNSIISNTSFSTYLLDSDSNIFNNPNSIGLSIDSFGFVFTNSNDNNIYDCFNITGILGDIYYVDSPFLATTSTNNSFINCSYRISGTNETITSSGSLFRKWYYIAKVNDSLGNPLNLAMIKIVNSSNSLQDTIFTNVGGSTARYAIIEYVNNGGTRSYYSNYSNMASLSGYETQIQTWNVSEKLNGVQSFVLQLSPESPSGVGGTDSGVGQSNYDELIDSNPMLDPDNPLSPVYDPNDRAGESSGEPVIVIDPTNKNISWMVQTNRGGGIYTMILSKLIPKRPKSMVYTNLGTEPIDIKIECEGKICPYIIFPYKELNIPVGRTNLTVIKFDVDFTTVKLGKYSGNLVSIDQYGNNGTISITASKGGAGILIDLFYKLIGKKIIKGYEIYYVFFYFPLFLLVFFMMNYFLHKLPAGTAIAMGIAVFSVVVLLLLI